MTDTLNPPAFARPESETCSQQGMSLKDYFAAAALQGMCSMPFTEISHDTLARVAYEIADAMLSRRSRIR